MRDFFVRQQIISNAIKFACNGLALTVNYNSKVNRMPRKHASRFALIIVYINDVKGMI